MTFWLVGQTLRHAPRRAALGALGVAFPVAMLGATLIFVGLAVNTMTRVALQPVQVEQRALAASLNVDLGRVGQKLAAIPGVRSVDRFASADVIMRPNGSQTGATARLFAVDPVYLRDHPWVHVVTGSLTGGALLDQSVRDYSPGFAHATSVTIDLPGRGRNPLTLPVAGSVDLRRALPTWFSIPAGEVQGDVALVPRAVVIPYATFERTLLPALKAKLGPTTPVLNPGLTDLPPVSLEDHIAVDHNAYPSDPAAATVWSDALRHLLERQTAPGTLVVSDNAAEPLLEASSDATNAKILFLLLGIPGALAAGALGLAAQSALTESQRREDALLRLRGATERQLVQVASLQAMISGLTGSLLGLLVSLLAVSAVEGRAAWNGVSSSNLALAAAAAVALGIGVTAIRVVMLLRTSRRAQIASDRYMLERGWRPLWLRAYIDVLSIAAGLTILLINLLTGGLHQTPIAASQGSTLGLSFYVLLAPILLWVGLTLLTTRLMLKGLREVAMPRRVRPLPSWRGAALRWLARRPARTGTAMVLGALAVAFGVEVVTFVATYESAKRADALAAFGSDLRLTPGDPLYRLPRLGPRVARTTPIREIPVRAGSDRKTVLAIDMRTYGGATTASPSMISGDGLAALARDPSAVLVAEEIATDFAVAPGDSLPLTFFPDDQDKSRNITLHVAGIFRSFPPSNPYAEMVMSTAGMPAYLVPPPDFYLARTSKGQAPATVADDLNRRPPVGKHFAVTTLSRQSSGPTRSLTALNLTGLDRLQSVGAALIAAVGVALLGWFLVLERRREFAVLEAIGADRAQLVTGPVTEGAVAVAGSIIIGLPLGFGLGALVVRVLGLFFALPPPFLTVPPWTLLGFVALMAVTSAGALAITLTSVTRSSTAATLREP